MHGDGWVRYAAPMTDENGASTGVERHIVAAGVGFLLVFALLAFPLDLGPRTTSQVVSERAHARIEAVTPATDVAPPLARIVFVEGRRAGQQADAQVEGPSGQLQLPDYRVGDDVVAAIDHQPDGTESVAVIDRWRLPLLQGLVGAFALIIVVVAGWRGLRSLVSLALTLILTMQLLIPLLLAGWSPVGLAVGFGILVTVASLLLTQGLSRATIAAILGTAIGLAITGVLAVVTTTLARFTIAQGSEQVVSLQQLAGDRIDLSGLLLAAVIFGGLGVLNDVAVSQAVTVEELHDLDPRLSRRQLYGRTMRVGVAHLGATINTLVFAYLGTALPLLVLLALQIQNFRVTLSEAVIAVEIVRTVVGSIGILSAVPFATELAAWLIPAGRSVPSRTTRVTGWPADHRR
jgi:uncharacterized membrane protein